MPVVVFNTLTERKALEKLRIRILLSSEPDLLKYVFTFL